MKSKEHLNIELKHRHYDNFFGNEEKWLEYKLEQLRKYITDYINGEHQSKCSLPNQKIYPAFGIKKFVRPFDKDE